MNNIDRNLLTAIKTKPFVILAGLSGSGKSREVRSLAYQFCSEELKSANNGKPGNFELIKVKPNWHDSAELLGYESRISGIDRYIITEFMLFVIKAWKNLKIPFFVCLDEMNLAPVEQYFAEFLSAIETRRNGIENTVVTDSLVNNTIFQKYDIDEFWKQLSLSGNESDSNLKQQFMNDGLTIPPNLIIIGTVNMDESTHSFSRKVLDRAMTIEMNVTDLNSGLKSDVTSWVYPETPLQPDLVLGTDLNVKSIFANSADNGKKLIEFLEKINLILKDSPFSIAYRIRDESLIYTNYFIKLNGSFNDALDNITVMKILPRIEGDSERTEKILTELSRLEEIHKLKKTKDKLMDMKTKLEKYHFTSYWN